MDLSDVTDRAELRTELARRIGIIPEGRSRPRLDEDTRAAWTLFEAACRFYGASDPEPLVKSVNRAHEQYTALGAVRAAGFAFDLCCELVPQTVQDGPVSPGVDWAVRTLATIQAGLGDQKFSALVSALDDALTALRLEADLCPAS